MSTKGMIGWALVAAALGGAAYYLNGNNQPATPQLNGKAILPDLSVQDVARIEIGTNLTLAAGSEGWTVETLYGYPASREKIAENLLRLTELKVGQVARGRALGQVTDIVLKDAAGKNLASLKMGDTYAGRFAGRYLAFQGETVLVTDALDVFDGTDAKRWCETKIGKSDLYFNAVIDPKTDEATLGFATGTVCQVTWKEGTNSVSAAAHIGGTTAKGDRYFKMDGSPWTYAIPSYAADNLIKKEETKKEAAK